MGLLDEIEAAGRRYKLKVDQLLEELDPEDRDALEHALRDPRRYATRQIVRALRNRGVSVSTQAVENWRTANESR